MVGRACSTPSIEPEKPIRVCAGSVPLPDRQVGDQSLTGEELLCLLEAEVVGRDDQIRRRQVVVRQRLATLPDRLRHEPEHAAEVLLVAVLDCLSALRVELVQRLDDVVVHPELAAAAQQPGDHCSSSFFSPPAPSSAFIFASSSSTWDDDESCASSRSSCVWSDVKSSSAPEVVSSSIALARACICSVLSLARWIASPVSAICSPIPVAASPIRTDASAAEYCALITSFCERKASIFAWSCFSLATSFSCCCSSCCTCWSSPWSCCWTADFRSRAWRARSSRPAERACRACVSSLTTLCSSCCVCIWRRFFAVTTSATPRFTFWSNWSCRSYE